MQYQNKYFSLGSSWADYKPLNHDVAASSLTAKQPPSFCVEAASAKKRLAAT